MSYPLVPLSVIARPIARSISVVPGISYRTIGVKWWGEGAYERETIDGAQTAAKALSIVREDDLIINKIWVRHGSTAIATEAVDGCAASGEFPTFELDRDQIEPRWIHWLTKTPSFWTDCADLSRGSSGKNRIKPELFLTIRIPLPPLAEQRRIVARIEALAAKIEEAKGLRRLAVEEGSTLCRSILFSNSSAWERVPMRDLVGLRDLDIQVQRDQQYQFAGVYCFGGGVFLGLKKNGMEFAYPRLTRLKAGDFVYPKLMAWEGALGIVPAECDGLVVSPEFPVFSVNENRVLTEVLDVYFRSPTIWPELAAISTGTNVRRRRLNPNAFLDYKLPLPPREVQEQLRDVKILIDKMKPLQAQTATELNALLPSILDKAFKGEL